MLFNSTDNLFFAVTLLHGEISFCPSLMEISSTLWHCFWGIGQDDAVVRVFVEKEKSLLIARIAEQVREYRQGLTAPQAFVYLAQTKETKERVTFKQLIAELDKLAAYEIESPRSKG